MKYFHDNAAVSHWMRTKQEPIRRVEVVPPGNFDPPSSAKMDTFVSVSVTVFPNRHVGH